MPQSIRATLCESARKLGYVPVTGFEPLQGPEVVNIDAPSLSPIWFAPPGPSSLTKDTDIQELPKAKIRTTRYRQRGKPREECEVTQEEALVNMLAGTSLASGPNYEQGKSVSSHFSPSLHGPDYVPRCLSMDSTPTPKPASDLAQRSNTERGRKARRSVPYSLYLYCPALQQPDRSRGTREPSPMTVVSD
ncbi:hypothetical protein IW261DRAFT_1557725 [Armillaria novae-zelandiae]|uniref:Uncharacterized protein n=1 Tax=Armillaria novae-zelandiae TaxID=153914 RepID=A0AA39UIQ1_9AGAR|nr:hypothetical protein IW261DRAFT_1557725 [Armillaria novae-zelandiae]